MKHNRKRTSFAIRAILTISALLLVAVMPAMASHGNGSADQVHLKLFFDGSSDTYSNNTPSAGGSFDITVDGEVFHVSCSSDDIIGRTVFGKEIVGYEIWRTFHGTTVNGGSCDDNDPGGEDPGETDYCDPSQRPDGMSIAEWHEANDFPGPCVDFDFTDECGEIDADVDLNLTGLFYEVVALVDTVPDFGSHPVADSTNSFPIQFDEDEFGGEVTVYLWLEGAEKDFLVGSGIANFWDANPIAVDVDTDCEGGGGGGEEEDEEPVVLAQVEEAEVLGEVLAFTGPSDAMLVTLLGLGVIALAGGTTLVGRARRNNG